jgi:ribosomal protein L35
MPHPSKTHRGAGKRFRVGAAGRLKVNRISANHLKSGKTAKMRRKHRHARTLEGKLAKNILRLLGKE